MDKKKILVVDDEKDLLELIEKSLTNEGYDVTTVTTAEEAVKKAKTLMPDLMLMDIILPDMEGPEAVRILSESSLTSKIPIMFLSGIVTREKGGGAVSEVRVGERKYRALSKPFSSQELIEELQKIIS